MPLSALLSMVGFMGCAEAQTLTITNPELNGGNNLPPNYNSTAPTGWSHWSAGGAGGTMVTVDTWSANASSSTNSGYLNGDASLGEYWSAWNLGVGVPATPTGNGWVGIRTNYYFDQEVAKYYGGTNPVQASNPYVAHEGFWQELTDLEIDVTYRYDFWYINAGNANSVADWLGSYSADGSILMAFVDSADLGGDSFTPNASPTLRAALVDGSFVWDDQTDFIPYQGNGSQTWQLGSLEFTATAETGYLIFSSDARATPVQYHSFWSATFDDKTNGHALNAYMGMTGISIAPIPEPSSVLLGISGVAGLLARRRRAKA